jgi:hypothetical protein
MSTLQRFCKFCKKPILKHGTVYCSPQCVAEGLKSEQINCKNCGTKFRPPRKAAQFCSLNCFNEDRIKKARLTPEPPPVSGARWIPLTQGKFALVDDDDYLILSRFNWCSVKVRSNERGQIFYAKRTDIDEYMQRSILNPPDGMEVDHLGNTLDNRRSQLRVVNKSQNQMNRYSNTGSSIYKGVYKIKGVEKYAARVDASGRKHHLGRFDNEIEAAKAYDAAARVYQGSQARLNFPNPGERSALHKDCEFENLVDKTNGSEAL